ncbi:T9SS type A sorting domain-containing protein [Flammeovirga aprica]|uniref:T9SS type A sorting domain-containing protein n=1 Tax=Flammeovirga aprica JL-4 TaxID=694437 RepID=A0A7X9NZX7_9BACT|nr:T9SS type A sorting domain-containing protein [Flammeovirga aprica]NME66968.1 T9SS type A sorting domain-containing protein [Flammeovirga aprica JL-4]
MKKVYCLTFLLWTYCFQSVNAQCVQTDLAIGAFGNYYIPSDYELCSDLRADLNGVNGITSASLQESSLTIKAGTDITITAATFSFFYVNLIIEEGAILRINGNMQIEDTDPYDSSFQIDGQLIISGDLSTSAWSFREEDTGADIVIDGNGYVQIGGDFNSGTMDPDKISDGITWDIDCGNIKENLTCSDLPVELSYFQASVTEETVILEWETATEVNSSHFDIERTLDLKNWEKIGTLQSSGNSQTAIFYEFEDDLLSEKSYYRLKQVDIDGKYTYYGPIEVNKSGNSSLSMMILPNRISSGEEVQFSISGLSIGNDIQIQVYNNQGHLVYYDKVVDNNVNHFLKTTNINDQLSSGMYFVVVNSGRDIVKEKLLVN